MPHFRRALWLFGAGASFLLMLAAAAAMPAAAPRLGGEHGMELIKIEGVAMEKSSIKGGAAYGLSAAACSPNAKLSRLQIVLALAIAEAEREGYKLHIEFSPLEGAKEGPEGPAPETH